MSFIKKYNRIVQKVGPIRALRLWVKSIIFSAVIYALCYGYYLLTKEGATGTRLWSQTLADSGMVVIGVSFLMSGLTYFWDFVDTKIIYRKHIGLVGFYMTAVHVYIALRHAFLNPARSFGEGWDVLGFFLGCLSLAIFLEMTIVSNQYSVRELGNKAWRIILRTGYVAYLFAVVHTIFKKYDVWQNWLDGKMSSFPPLSLVIVVFSLVVFGMRIALWIALRNKKEEEVVTEAQESV